MRKPSSPKSLAIFHHAVTQRGRPRLAPPENLPKAQKLVWHQTVDALPPEWFATEHEPLLLDYANHVVRAAQIEVALSKLDLLVDFEIFGKMSKLAALESGKIQAAARAMRLTQQSRLRAETASNRAGAAALAAFDFEDDPDGLLAR
jgi:hypothetical protein